MIFCSETFLLLHYEMEFFQNSVLYKEICSVARNGISDGEDGNGATYPRNYFTSRWKSSWNIWLFIRSSPWLLQSVKINFDSSGDFERRSVILRKFALNISIFRTSRTQSIKTFEKVSVSSGASLRDSAQLRFSWN